ncbi:MAG: ATP synthase F1 subunit delta [Planctomycetota bacterium]
MKTQHSQAALAYAEALVESAEERNSLEAVANDAGALKSALDDNPDLVPFFRDPSITQEERQAVLDKALADADETFKRFVAVLNGRGRIGSLPETLDAFEYLLDQRLGKVEVDVTTAKSLTDDELANVTERLTKILGRDPVVHQYVDESIIGGLVLRVGDTVLDASVQRQLEAMRERLRS